MSSLGQGDDKVTKDLLYIGGADVNAVDNWGNNVLKYSFLSPSSRKLLLAVEVSVNSYFIPLVKKWSGSVNSYFISLLVVKI